MGNAFMRGSLLLGLILLPATSLAQPVRAPKPAAASPAITTIDTSSPCAALPDAGQVAVAAPAQVVPAQPTPERGLQCPDDFTLDLKRRLPSCVGGLVAGPGRPRAECYARLALGPIAALPDRRRPAPSCRPRTITTVLALRGANIGWREVAVAAAPGEDVQLTSLFDTAEAVPVSENPVVRACLAPDCRLVRLAIGPDAPAELAITATLPGGSSASQVLQLRRTCPAPER